MSGEQPAGGEIPWIAAGGGDSPDAQQVEMRRNGDVIEVRDSLDPGGPVLRFTPAEWDAWLDGVRKGEFDHLCD
ncbi:MAG: DUF397 domain-containing protein [Actinomycetales bacterium]|nr:DUF397 domain-containing protein [Actinomycetales bacterium]